MIRRTLINRARRQRDLARMLIARHSLMAYDHSQPLSGYRLASSNDDYSWLAPALMEAEPAFYDATPSEAESVVYDVASREAEMPLAAWPQSLTPSVNVDAQRAIDASSAISIAERIDASEDGPAPRADSLQPAVATDQRLGNTLADLVRRMRDPAWVPPEAASSATTTSTSAATEPTASEQIADMVRQMQKPPQRTTPKPDRPRIPLGQRMSEAADFGQTPASPHYVDPVAAPAHDEQPAEVAERQPAQVVFETEHPAADGLGGDVTHPPEQIAPVESVGEELLIASADDETAALMFTAEEPQPIAAHPDAPMPNLSAPLDKAEPPIEPHALSQASQNDTIPTEATALPPSQAAAAKMASQLQNPDAPMALPASATSDLRAPAESRQTINTPPTLPSAAHPQPSESALAAAARATAPIAPDRPAAVTPPSKQPTPSTRAQSNLGIHEPHSAAADVPRRLADPAPTPAVAATPAGHAQTNATPTWPVELESQRSSSEANTLAAPTQAPDAPALDTVETRSAPSEIAKESQPASFRLHPERPSVPVAHLGVPMRSANIEPVADSQSISDARSPQIEHAGAQQSASESAPTAPDRDSPQGLAARLSWPDQPVSAHIADTTRNASQPNAAQQTASEAPNPVGLQLDGRDTAPDLSTRQPAAMLDRATPPITRIGQAAPAHVDIIDVPALEAETRISQRVPIQPEQAPALSQQLRVPQSDNSSAQIAPAGKDAPVAPKAAETLLARSSDLAEEPGAITAANDLGATHDVAHYRAAIATTSDEPAAGASPARTEVSIPSSQGDERRGAPGYPRWVPRLQSPAPEHTPHPNEPGVNVAGRASAPTIAVSFDQEPRSVLPSPDQRSSIIHDVPGTADDVPAADTPMLGSPEAWAARFARHREMTEPQAEPITARTSAMPINQPAAPAVDADASVAPAPGSPQAWAARFARHRQMTEPQAEPTAARAPTILTNPSMSRAAPATDADAESTVAPGSPQAWAARFVRHRQMTEPQSEPIAVRTPAAPNRWETTIADPAPSTPARFIPARRADLGAVSAVPVDMHTAATERLPVAHDATAATADIPAAAVPEPGSPQAWASRFARHREMTEPHAESTTTHTPATRFDQPTLPTPPAIAADAPTASEPGSPQAWAARLFPQAQPASPQIPPNASQRSAALTEHQDLPAAPPIATPPPPTQLHRVPDNLPQVALRRAVPTPIAETTRRFLQPLVGIDPAEVRVFRGPAAGQVTAAYQAEALASGDMVALAAEHGEDSPATLGVLAHELTHIARQRDSRFVPPLVRRENISGVANEESLAQSVEMQVRRIARGHDEAIWRAPTPLDAPSSSALPANTPIDAPVQPRPTAPDTQPFARDAGWGGLPAPWEPLPGWFDAPKQAEMQSPAVSPPIRSTPPAQQAAARNVAPSMPPVQLAETGRMLDAPPAQSTPVAAPAQQPAPDLDALARQVYAVLKQRLAAERRRSQS